MKKQLSKILMVLITMSMVLTLLPVQIASAAGEDIAAYAHYGTEEGLTTYGTDGWHGHVFKLEEEAGTYYDHKLTVGVYNIDQSRMFTSALEFDPNVVDLVDYEYGGVFSESTSSSDLGYYMIYPNVDSTMTTSARYATEPITKKLFEASPYITKNETTGHFDVLVNFETATGLNAAEWTTDAGAVYSTVGDGAAFGYPKGTVYTLYTMYFKVKENQEITSNTFSISYNESNDFYGGMGKNMHNLQGVKNCEGVYLIGFKEPELAPVNVTFTGINDQNGGAAISGATVTLYSDEAMSTQIGEGTTDPSGAVTISSIPANKECYYKIAKADYVTKTGKINVGTSNTSIDPISLTKLSDVKYDLTVTVKNADDGTLLSGATVSVDNSEIGTTTDGVLTAQYAAGSYTVKASMDGYQTSAGQSVTVDTSGGSVEIKLVPNRVSVTLPVIKDAEGAPVPNAKFTVVKTSSNATAAWGESVVYNAGERVEVPANTAFKLTSSLSDYSTATLYMKSAAATATLYSDSGLSSEFTGDVTVTKVGDPYYNVVIKKGEDETTYTAAVTLKNIDANYGTFGLRYDKALFDFGSFTLDTGLEYFTPGDGTSAMPKSVTTNSEADTIGYHVFTWKAPDGTSLDTLAEEKPIGTYTFTLKGSAADINADSFAVMPYDKTENGTTYIDTYGVNAETNEFLSKLWRYVDEENEEAALGDGRLEKSKASDRGFYQAFALEVLISENPGIMADVMTKITYDNFESNYAGLVFEVVDEEGTVVPDTEIKLYAKNGTEAGTLKTDSTGIAKTTLDTKGGSVTYGYTAECKGYWSVENGTVTVEQTDPPTTEYVYLTLEEKIYHNTVLKGTDDSTEETLNAELSGDEFAYNRRDYHFDIEADPGYEYDRTKPVVAVIDGTEYTVEFNKEANMYVIPGDKIVQDKTSDTPDENGFPSGDITIKIDPASIRVSDDKYTVTALAGANGKVEYAGSGAGVTTEGTSKVTVSNISALGETEEFTFTADDGYKVERVVINGVEIDAYDNLGTFKYKFTNITEDSSIAVTFWDGVTHSDETIVTLAVGERGKVDVSTPNTDTGITNARRTYIYDSASLPGTLAFTATPDEGYLINKVEKEVITQSSEGESVTTSEEVTGTTTAGNAKSYSVEVGKSQNMVVYVTFKEENAEDTFNVFVKSYIDSGKGTISPIGVLTYNKYDRPKFVMTAADTDWMLTSVKIDDVKQRYDEQAEDDEQLQSGTYQFDSLLTDRSIGAVFKETAYTVYGIVDLAQGSVSPLTSKNAQSGATLTFTREDGTEDGMKVIATSDVLRQNATFEAKLAKGTWKVVVTKRGYLNYTITDFEVTPSQTRINFGASTPEGDAKPIVLIIGNTSGKGTVVSLEDAGVVGSALRPGASDKICEKGDVDNDGDVKVDSDMAYIKANYGRRQVVQTYAKFVNN